MIVRCRPRAGFLGDSVAGAGNGLGLGFSRAVVATATAVEPRPAGGGGVEGELKAAPLGTCIAGARPGTTAEAPWTCS